MLLLVAILGILVSSTRPRTDQGSLAARKPSYLARYTPATALDLPSKILFGAAFAEATAFLGVDRAGVLLSVAVVMSVAYVLNLQHSIETIVGMAATFAVVATQLGVGPCAQGRTLGVDFLPIVFTPIFIVATLRIFSVVVRPFRRLPAQVGLASSALLVFAVIEVALFVVNPEGSAVLSEAPFGWHIGILGSVAAISVLGYYAPRQVMALLSIAVVYGTVFLKLEGADQAPGVCANSSIWLFAFVVGSAAALTGSVFSTN